MMKGIRSMIGGTCIRGMKNVIRVEEDVEVL